MPEKFVVDRVDRVADILFGVAHAKGVIGYGPLGRRIGMQPNHLGGLLEQVSQRAAHADEPLWSALVVSRETGRPSSGFYGLARRVRAEYATLADDEVWRRERERCYAAAS